LNVNTFGLCSTAVIKGKVYVALINKMQNNYGMLRTTPLHCSAYLLGVSPLQIISLFTVILLTVGIGGFREESGLYMGNSNLYWI
jgi:hypothetical protein